MYIITFLIVILFTPNIFLRFKIKYDTDKVQLSSTKIGSGT